MGSLPLGAEEPKFYPTSTSLRLRNASQLDPRTDEEIVKHLLTFRPVTSAKNVWAFWDKGFLAMKPWRQRNVINWVRRLDSSWDVRVLDAVDGSPHHYSNFISKESVPSAVRNSTMTGRYAGIHTSDHIRLPLLINYGGVWMDIGLILLRDLDDICWDVLSSPSHPHSLCSIIDERTLLLSFNINSFIASLPQNPFLIQWHAVFSAIWANRDTSDGISSEPLLQHVPQFDMNPQFMALLGDSVTSGELSDYAAQMISFSRVIGLVDPVTGFNGNKYWHENCRMFPATEIYAFDVVQTSDGYSETRQAELMAMKRTLPIDRNDPDQIEAEKIVEGTLAGAAFKKLSQGPFQNESLSSIWGKCVDGKEDIREGTWAEYFRWGSVNLDQERELQPLKEVEGRSGYKRKVWKVGVLEPIEPGKTELIEGW